MHLILVRHGHPQVVRDAPEVADPGLSELGEWQAQRLCDWLAHEDVDAVITSPKRRAIETVSALIDRGLPHEIVADLDEIDRGSSTYLPTELLLTEGGEYFEHIRAQRWADIGWDDPETFQTRVLGAFADIVARRPGARVVIASHGGTMNRWFAHLYRVGERVSFNVPYASISRVEVSPDGLPRILSINETGHFDAVRSEVAGPMRDGRGYLGMG